MLDPSSTPPAEHQATKAATAAKAAFATFQRTAITVITLMTEVAVVAFIGATIGGYLSAKTIVTDCQRVNLAKVGDVYVNCTVVEPKKDPATAAPR
jgi:hypothetical protein